MTAAPVAGARTTCSSLTKPGVYNVFTLYPAGATVPEVSCAEAVEVASAACPRCVGVIKPVTAELSEFKFPGTGDPRVLTWAVSWTPGSCNIDSPHPAGGFMIVRGASGCHLTTFVSASSGKVFLQAAEIG